MKTFANFAFTIGAAALFAGCGAAQTPIGAPATGQRMLPHTSSQNLLYVSSLDTGLYVFTYPDLKFVGHPESDPTEGLCSDGKGNVFAVQFDKEDILEYSHGSSVPSKVLDDTGNAPWGCAVDPTTGNLAVVGGNGNSPPQNVAIFANASGSPTVHSYYFGAFIWCTYDDNGNLFITNGFENVDSLYEITKGSSTLTPIYLDEYFGDNSSVQWDGKYLALQDAPKCCPRRAKGPLTIYQVQVSGSTGTIVNTLTFDKATNKNREYDYGIQFWIQGDGTLIAPKAHDNGIGLWKYPAAGSPRRRIAVAERIYGVTVSLAASR